MQFWCSLPERLCAYFRAMPVFMKLRWVFTMATIIIVDDEKEILEPLEEMLRSEGYDVKAFSSSVKAEDLSS